MKSGRRNSLLWLVCAVFSTTVSGCGSQAPTTADQDAAKSSPAAAEADTKSVEEAEGITAVEVLDRLTAAYQKAESYFDNAEYCERHVYKADGVEVLMPPHVVAVSFRRPNQVRIQRNVPMADGTGLQVSVACDGKRYQAHVSDLPTQLLDRPAPAELTRENICPDPALARALMPVPLDSLYPQLEMLMSTAAAPSQFLAGAVVRLLPSQEYKGKPCYRVQLSRGQAAWVLWIDQKSSELRRLDMPTGEVRAALDPTGNLKELSLWIDFHDASLSTSLANSTFTAEFPATAKPAEALVAPGQEAETIDTEVIQEQAAEQLNSLRAKGKAPEQESATKPAAETKPATEEAEAKTEKQPETLNNTNADQEKK